VQAPLAMLAPLAFVLGCVVGSFLNVCIYRMPHYRSVVAPPSHCPQCGARLTWVDLIPLLSFLLLGRKCRHCGGPISWRYFLVELLTGVVFATVAWRYPGGWFVLPALTFVAVLIGATFTDLFEGNVIPDQLVVAGIVAAVANGALPAGLLPSRYPPSLSLPGLSEPLPRLGAAAAGAVLGPLVFLLIGAFARLLFRREGMGLGDVKLAAAIGGMLGPTLSMLSYGLAVVAGAMLGLVLIGPAWLAFFAKWLQFAVRWLAAGAEGRRTLLGPVRPPHTMMPFGPFMAAAAFVALLSPAGLPKEAGIAWKWYVDKWTVPRQVEESGARVAFPSVNVWRPSRLG
jgi:leader peptidase (prepilin peptidase)/N-methyltransferase